MKSRSVRRHRLVFAVCIGAGAVIASLWAIGGRNTDRGTSIPALHTRVRPENIVLANTPPGKRIYPYSVIPGGVQDRQDLADAIARDSVVADHYRSLSIGSVRVESIAEDRLAYVSYRIGNKTYWTKNKVRLKKGETILTDGLTQVRGRCGNCISLEPMAPTSDAEPEAVQFDALVAPGAAGQPSPRESATLGAGTILPAELMAGPSQGSVGSGTSGIIGTGPFVGGGVPGGASGGSAPSGNSSGSVPGLIPPGAGIELPPIIVPPAGGPNGGGTPPDSPFTTPPDSPFSPPTDPLPPLVVEVPPVIVQPPPTDTAPVPEPGTLLLIGSGLATMLARRRNSSSTVQIRNVD